MQKKKKQMFAYGANIEGSTYFVGMSRKWDLKKATEGLSVEAGTVVFRLHSEDMINTELGYVRRGDYLSEKKDSRWS